MSRPSHNVDRKLLAAGRAMLAETGPSGLNIRNVARRAGVNLGMFHYHFGTKEAFLDRVLQETYEEFFSRLTLDTSGPGSPLEKLERALFTVGRFARDRRPLLFVLLREAMDGHKPTIAFAARNLPRHLAIVRALVEECWRRRLLLRASLPQTISFLLSTMGIPSLVAGLVDKSGARRPMGLGPGAFKAALLSDSALRQRARLAIRALETRRK
ncbi:MAG: TetR/AcrR family transcriptional regulator [Elusimicrobia bacterium]|nr:TetR/AcrR family transcriptional regulator [Elusimicrobiota bacterium]